MKQFIDDYFNEEQLFPEIDRIKSMILNSIQQDPFRPLDYGFSFTDFLNSYNVEIDYNHVKYGIKPYISTRMNASLAQVENPDFGPIITQVEHELDFTNGSLRVRARVTDNQGISSAKCCYSHNDGQEICVNMNDEGIYPDFFWNDGIYTALIPIDDFSGVYYYYIRSADQNNHVARYPVCEEYTVNFGHPSASLKINEFMADNEGTIADGFGEYDDWVELFNNGPDSIFLGDKFISDDPQEPLKWKLPYWWIQSGEYLLFWADDDEEDQGEDHLGFKLSKEGEFIGVYDVIAGETTLLDGLNFGEQQEDISLGRYPDGTGEFQFMEPTPGGPNVPNAVIEPKEKHLRIFPNPAKDVLYLDSEWPLENLELLDIHGRAVPLEMNHNKLNISVLNPGLYLLRCYFQDNWVVEKIVIK
jgi:hypothetical protein